MKILQKAIERDKSGAIKLIGDEKEDMWHIYNIIMVNDLVTASTVRKIQTQSTTGSVDNSKIRLNLQIRVVSIDFDSQATSVRLNGRVSQENMHVKMGAFHSIDLELHQPFTVYKQGVHLFHSLEWDQIYMDRIHQACDPTQSAQIAAIVV